MTERGTGPTAAGPQEAEPRTLLVTLAYDGTGLVGWQRQPAGVSVQGLLEDALAPIEGAKVAVTGAGRTDAGVHAIGQRASFAIRHPLPPSVLQRALNARLPAQVRVTAIEERPAGFNARFDALGKTYRYIIDAGAVADPFAARYAWHVPQPLDVPAMAAAVALLQGTHDFAAFQSTGTDVEGTVRTIGRASCELVAASDGAPPCLALPGARRLAIELSGDGFLRHMVRAVVGTLVEIGRGQRAAGDMARVLASRDRSTAGATAPAHGLCLVEVRYRAGFAGRFGGG